MTDSGISEKQPNRTSKKSLCLVTSFATIFIVMIGATGFVAPGSDRNKNNEPQSEGHRIDSAYDAIENIDRYFGYRNGIRVLLDPKDIVEISEKINDSDSHRLYTDTEFLSQFFLVQRPDTGNAYAFHPKSGMLLDTQSTYISSQGRDAVYVTSELVRLLRAKEDMESVKKRYSEERYYQHGDLHGTKDLGFRIKQHRNAFTKEAPSVSFRDSMKSQGPSFDFGKHKKSHEKERRQSIKSMKGVLPKKHSPSDDPEEMKEMYKKKLRDTSATNAEKALEEQEPEQKIEAMIDRDDSPSKEDPSADESSSYQSPTSMDELRERLRNRFGDVPNAERHIEDSDFMRGGSDGAAQAIPDTSGEQITEPNNARIDVNAVSEGHKIIRYQGNILPKVGYDKDGESVAPEIKRNQVEKLMGRIVQAGDRWSLHYPSEGDTQKSIAIFSDPTCPYCQQLHKHIPELQKAGVDVYYLFYNRQISPGNADNPQAVAVEQQMENVWCSDNPNDQWDRLKSGQSAPTADCSTIREKGRTNFPGNEHWLMGRLIDMRGTPYIITDEGEVFPGFNSRARQPQTLLDKIGM